MRISQKERVLQYIKDFGSITSYEGFRDLGVARVPNRIMELIRDGQPIISTTESSRNRYGDMVSYKRYRLKESVQ